MLFGDYPLTARIRDYHPIRRIVGNIARRTGLHPKIRYEDEVGKVDYVTTREDGTEVYYHTELKRYFHVDPVEQGRRWDDGERF
jgi:hypothetical protein